MASDDYGQLTTILQRLGELGSLLNPRTLVRTVSDLIRELATPPPGDPGELEDLAAAFRTAANAIEPIGDEVRALGTHRLPDVWGDAAGGAAARVVTAAADAAATTPVVFRDTAVILEALAETARKLQRRHGELHQGLYDAYHDATHVAGLPIPDPLALDDLARAVSLSV